MNRTRPGRWRDQTSSLRDSVRTQLWPLPTLGILCALGLGIGLPQLDAHTGDALPPTLAGYLFGGGPDAARTLSVPSLVP